jgi:hypothetical protein
MHILKKIIIIAILAGILYALMGYHYVFIGKMPKVLKKSQLTLKYTIFSTSGKTTKSVLSIPDLWNDGIGELYLEEGLITEEEYERYRLKMAGEEEY